MTSSTLAGYSFIAPVYDKIFLRPLSEGHEEIGSLIRRSRVKGKLLRVLEVGVGSGLGLPHLPTGVDFTGIDVNEKMLDVAQRKAELLRTRKISLHLMNAERMNFPSNTFDMVVAPSVLSAMERPQMGMKEIMRVTRRGGKIAVIVNLQKEGTFKGNIMKILDPLTRRFLGFRLDMRMKDFEKFKGLKLIEAKEINNLLGSSLSTYLLFEKTM